MDFDDDDDDFESDEEFERKRAEERKRVANLPITKKGNEIFETISSLVATIDSEKDKFRYQETLFEDIAIINAKIRGAEAGDLYTLRMENAVLIKVHARSIITITSGLKMMNLGYEEHLNLLREEMEEFRILFVDWVNSFDKSNDIPDDWGLFYS
ncbi:hypothetical protein [Lacihabitans soyangensis]|uniref:Uncharacterized protein n=1 Tax=Lacihabitans soyangensis TaxID=869394 RepID=A0AAE3H055_9BACT|nr:hypothetical protein [Lacihabitans soyangensis]MCP9761855.1 hypothetical protein [Lacihabitans soyangensis]